MNGEKAAKNQTQPSQLVCTNTAGKGDVEILHFLGPL